MAAESRLILDLAGAILDGDAIDWASLASSVSDSQRAVFLELRAIGSLRHRPPRLPLSMLEPLGLATWGHLKVLEPIGRGGFGTVYRAWDPQLAREVALKLLPADEDGVNAVEEGQLLAKIHHPNVVTIFGADRIGAYVGLTMEFVSGATLEQVLAKEGPFTPTRAAALGRQLCEALRAVHHAGLVHRDVKAHNVMLAPSGRLVLMDFGAGRLLSTDRHDVAGTPLYLAPEIFAGASANEQSEIYSVGVLLYHLLTTQYPVEGLTLRDVRDAHHHGTAPPAVRLARPDVPRRLAAAIECALAVRPGDRFQSADQMAAALTKSIAGTRPARAAMIALAILSVVVVAGIATGVMPTFSRIPYSSGSFGASAFPSDAPTTRRLSLPNAELFGRGLSDNGQYFSFLDEDGALTVFDMSTSRTETLVRADGEEFAEFSIMSPDGKQAAYQWWTSVRRYEIRIVDRVTKSVRVLVRDETLDNPMPVEWSRDGSSILLWLKSLQGTGHIALADAASGSVHVVRDIPAGEPLGLSLSPDSRYVAYDLPMSPANEARTLHIVDLAGNSDRTLLKDPDANDRFPLWSPDGLRLFFISDRAGSSDGWLVPVQEGVAIGEPALIVRNLGRVSSLGLTGTGAFYYRLQAGAFEVNEITLDPITTTFLSPPRKVARRFAASNIAPSYSADGRQLAYISVREGLGGKPSRAVVIKDLATGTERELSLLRLGNSPARWAPDGRRLLVGSRVIDVKSGRVLQEFNAHADKDVSSYGPTGWGTDGQSVVYEHEDTGLVRHPLNGGQDEIVYAYSPANPVQRIHRFEISRDGLHLAFSGWLRDGTGTVLQVIAPGGQIELARRTAPEALVVQGWSPDSQFILFTTHRTNEPPPHRLWRVPVWGGPPDRLGSIDAATQINPMAFNPTGSALAYTTGTPLNELWMMTNFLPR